MAYTHHARGTLPTSVISAARQNFRSGEDFHVVLLPRSSTIQNVPDPISTSVVKKLLSLETPIATRVFEIALLLGLILASAYVYDHFKDNQAMAAAEFAAMGVCMFGTLGCLL